MAIMIPVEPYYFDKRSQEDIMFKALETLPDDYYVFHSFRIYKEINSVLNENEIDFLIYNKNKGILILEAKSGAISCKNGIWKYQNGTVMKHGGPFEQASHNRWKIYDLIQSNPSVSHIVKKCKICSGVWLISFSRDDVNTHYFPLDIDKKMILTKESLIDPLNDIERIFSLRKYHEVETNLNELEHKDLILKVLCPEFDVVPTETFEADIKKTIFHRLLREQSLVLNFLSEQKTAIINGAAGTGKTLIAVQKALRHADNNEKVLFLCFNAYLRDYLEQKFKHVNIDFMTISKYACKECDISVPDYAKLREKLELYFYGGNFPYDHIIIDEGQDFGIDEIKNNKILETFKIIADSNEFKGTYYIFYDKLQLIQAKILPNFINDADCKITLYKNCRNTKNIAESSLRPITDRNAELYEGAVKGNPVMMHFCVDEEDCIKSLNLLINSFKSKGFKDIVLLTTKTEETSIMKKYVVNNMYRNKYVFTTCRKFKGLEADIVILIDIDETSFSETNKLIFYVGASRARIELAIITMLNEEQCVNILHNSLNINRKITNGKRELSNKLNTIAKLSQ